MSKLKKVVLTGGPCSGKTTIMRALSDEFPLEVEMVTEVATMLLGNGFPVPGKGLDWSEEWQVLFQSAVLPVQRSLEETRLLAARAHSKKLLVCDRGMLDGAGYSPGTVHDFCRENGLKLEEMLARYDVVIHFESTAVSAPEKYGSHGNDHRFEPIERAREIEQKILMAWDAHPRRVVIKARDTVQGKVAEAVGIVKYLLAEMR